MGRRISRVVLQLAEEGNGKVKHETVANISDLPDDLLTVIKNRLATGQPLVGDGGTMTIERSLPHGNVAAVLGTMQNIGLDQFIAARPCRERSLVMAMIADRILSPGSKLSCSAGMHPETARNTLAEELLKATEKDLDKIVPATQRARKPLHGEDGIGLAVG